MAESPITVLEAVLDEVEGIRLPIDKRSFLPPALVRRLRAAIEPEGPGTGQPQGLQTAEDMAGRTVAHVFDGGIGRADVLIVFTDATFIALKSDGYEDERSVSVHSGRGSKLGDYLTPRDQLDAGLIDKATYNQLTQEAADKRLKEAQQRAARARAELKRAEEEVAQLAPKQEAAQAGETL
jgi:hypothetical protein